LFPGEIGPLPVIREADSAAIIRCAFGIADLFPTPEDEIEQLIAMCIAGVITYRFATSASEHATRFAFYVGENEPGKDRTVLHVGRSVPQDKIVFLKEYTASYAD
jgi:hypothetical protein